MKVNNKSRGTLDLLHVYVELIAESSGYKVNGYADREIAEGMSLAEKTERMQHWHKT